VVKRSSVERFRRAAGLLPLAKGGDFARSIGLAGPRHAVETLAAGEVRNVDRGPGALSRPAGDRRERHFINIASFGLGGGSGRCACAAGAATCPAAPLSGRGAPTLGRGRGFDVRLWLDDAAAAEFHATTVALANRRYQGGGILIAPQAAIDDGLIDVTLVERVCLAEVAAKLATLLFRRYLLAPETASLARGGCARGNGTGRAAGTRRRAGGDVAARAEVLPRAPTLDLARRYGP